MGTTASGTGDPHLVNVHGQKFDLYQPGLHPLIRIPRSQKERTALLVQAKASRLGPMRPKWYKFNQVSVKVVHGHTLLGKKYLNVYLRGLNDAKVDIGGLLG